MQYSSVLRVLVVGGAVVAAVGSASSTQQQPTGYYPRPPQQQQQMPQQPLPPQPMQPAEFAEPEPPQQPPPPPAEPPPPPPQPPAQVARPSVETEPATEPARQPASAEPAKPAGSSIPPKRTQWVCNATGWWQKCESQGYQCYAQSTMMLGFGSTESAARVSAETECNTAMMRLMSVNFAYRTSVTSRCKAGTCSPPNAK